MRADVIGQDHESRYQHHVGCANCGIICSACFFAHRFLKRLYSFLFSSAAFEVLIDNLTAHKA